MRAIQDFLGHADAKTTQIYAHYAPSAHEVAMVNDAFLTDDPAARAGPTHKTPTHLHPRARANPSTPRGDDPSPRD